MKQIALDLSLCLAIGVGQVDLEQIAVWPDDEGGWFASNNEGRGFDFHGDTLNDAIVKCVNSMGSCDIGDGE